MSAAKAEKRDQLVLALGLAATIMLAWIYLVRASAGMNAMTMEAQMHAAMGMADMRTWGLAEWFGLFVMWAVMMAAMMLPSAAPLILLVLSVYRSRADRQARVAAITFVLGYILVWTAFSLAASAAQLALHRTALLAPDMSLGSSVLAGALLVAVGLYQWLPLKAACLSHCRSPFGFLSQHWREGSIGGLVMGARHGIFCVGCCWLLMTVLFVVGVMNLLWVAVLAGLVLVEKLVRRGRLIGRVAGAALAGWGLYLIGSP